MHEQWAEKFWSRVDKSAGPDACWPWTGCRQPRGYGHFYPAFRVNLYAHRVAWELANGAPVPAGMFVMHACDNPACVNPAHLSVGTQSDNMQDCARKGRAHRVSLQGEAHPNAKLTEAQVVEIRRRKGAGESIAVLAREFSVSEALIYFIANGRAWRHVLPDAAEVT